MPTSRENWLAVREARSFEPRPKLEVLAAQLGLKPPRVRQLSRLCRLPAEVQDMLDAGRLTPKHGEYLMALPESKRLAMAERAVAGKWKVARLRSEIAAARGRRDDELPHPDANMAALERDLGALVGGEVKVDHRADGSGWLRIRYTDLDTLDGVLERLGYRG